MASAAYLHILGILLVCTWDNCIYVPPTYLLSLNPETTYDMSTSHKKIASQRRHLDLHAWTPSRPVICIRLLRIIFAQLSLCARLANSLFSLRYLSLSCWRFIVTIRFRSLYRVETDDGWWRWQGLGLAGRERSMKIGIPLFVFNIYNVLVCISKSHVLT